MDSPAAEVISAGGGDAAIVQNSLPTCLSVQLDVAAGGAVLLDDVHDAPRHAGDAADAGSSGPGHGQADRGGHNEEVRPGGQLPDRPTQLLAAHQATSMGALRGTILLSLRQGKICCTVWP